MKSTVLTLSLILACAAPAPGQEQPKPTISVSGSAEIKVAPDEVLLNVGVETRDPQLALTAQQNNAQVASALSFLRDKGVPDKDVQTDYINITPEYRNDASAKVTTYVARKSIQIRLTKLDTMEAILTGLLAGGINHVNSVEFRTTQLRKYRDEARLLATRAAREKATAIVTELGSAIDKVASVQCLDYGGYPQGSNRTQNVVQNDGGSAEIESDTLSIGQISVSATVNVSFTIK